jgi:hypothetical protein
MATDRWIDEYLDYVKIHEDGDHRVFPYYDPLVKTKKYPDGIPTYEYGITQPIRDKYPKGANESEKDYAVRVLNSEFIPRVKSKIGEEAWNKMPNGMKKWASDLTWNAGGLSDSIAEQITNENYDGALKKGLEYVTASSRKRDGTKVRNVVRGLADRVASRHNLAASDPNIKGVKPISSFDVVKKPDNTSSLVYKSEGDTYHTFDKPYKANQGYTDKAPKNIVQDYPENTDKYALPLLEKPDTKNIEAVKEVQKKIGAVPDGDWGGRSQKALEIYNRQVSDNATLPVSDTYRQEGLQYAQPLQEPTGFENPFLAAKNWWNSL